jgi:hypothetical protein
VPPVFLLDEAFWIAGLGDGAAEDSEGADVVLLAGALAEPSVRTRTTKYTVDGVWGGQIGYFSLLAT